MKKIKKFLGKGDLSTTSFEGNFRVNSRRLDLMINEIGPRFFNDSSFQQLNHKSSIYIYIYISFSLLSLLCSSLKSNVVGQLQLCATLESILSPHQKSNILGRLDGCVLGSEIIGIE